MTSARTSAWSSPEQLWPKVSDDRKPAFRATPYEVRPPAPGRGVVSSPELINAFHAQFAHNLVVRATLERAYRGYLTPDAIHDRQSIERRLSDLEDTAAHLRADVRELKKQRTVDEDSRSRLEGAVKIVAELRTHYAVSGEDLSFLEHVASRPSLPGLLRESAAELRKRFDSASLALVWDDGALYLAVRTTMKAEEGETKFLEFLDWWLERRNLEDRTTVTLDYA